MDITAVGERIRSRRELLKLTQVDLAGRMGIAGAYISEIENGKRDIGLTMLARIADALECTPAAFLTQQLVKCDNSESGTPHPAPISIAAALTAKRGNP